MKIYYDFSPRTKRLLATNLLEPIESRCMQSETYESRFLQAENGSHGNGPFFNLHLVQSKSLWRVSSYPLRLPLVFPFLSSSTPETQELLWSSARAVPCDAGTSLRGAGGPTLNAQTTSTSNKPCWEGLQARTRGHSLPSNLGCPSTQRKMPIRAGCRHPHAKLPGSLPPEPDPGQLPELWTAWCGRIPQGRAHHQQASSHWPAKRCMGLTSRPGSMCHSLPRLSRQATNALAPALMPSNPWTPSNKPSVCRRCRQSRLHGLCARTETDQGAHKTCEAWCRGSFGGVSTPLSWFPNSRLSAWWQKILKPWWPSGQLALTSLNRKDSRRHTSCCASGLT